MNARRGEGACRHNQVCSSSTIARLIAQGHEHPAVAFNIRCAVEPAERKILEFAEDGRSGRTRSFVVPVYVVDRDVNAVDHPRCRQPTTGLIAFSGVVDGALVLRSRPPEHHSRAAEVQLGMRHPTVRIRVTLAGFLKAESFGQPIDRSSDILVRQHRRRLLHHAIVSAVHRGINRAIKAGTRYRFFEPGDCFLRPRSENRGGP